MTPLIISTTIFYLYVSYALYKFGLTKSISITALKLSKGDEWLFTAFMVGFSTALAFAAQGWMFTVAMFMAWIVGFAWNTKKNKLIFWLHIIGSFTMIISGSAGLWYHYGQWELVIIGAAGISSVWIPQVRSHTWLIEVWSMIVICFGIYLNIN